MYNIRIPYRRFALANKNGEFTTKIELSDRTKRKLHPLIKIVVCLYPLREVL